MSAGCGGAIYNLGTDIISNSLFEKNIAEGGGAICTAAFGAPSVQITNSTFYNNGAAQAGTGLGYGGAIALNATGTLTSTGTEFLENKAQFGGALAILPGATATVRDSVTEVGFRSNSATHSGGAIYNLGSLNLYGADISNNYISSNISVNGYGGGIASLGTLTIHNSFIYANEGLTGGGLYLAGGLDSSRADLQQVNIENNQVKRNGGGIFADNTTLTITNTNLSYNEAEGSGGGLACAQCARLRLSNSSFINNKAAYGGGLYVSAAAVSGYARVESVTFNNNQSTTSRGGAVYNQGSLELYFSSLVNNGNGVHNGPGASTRFRGSVLYNPGYNNCGSEGAAQYNNDGANHVSDNSCGPSFSAAGDPKLGPLQFEPQQLYWLTFYHLPLVGSPLINTGPGNCPARDQRGRLRPDACDIGAVEFGGLRPPAPSPTGSPVYLPIIVR
jgi:predicted outer membrane repeat protein